MLYRAKREDQYGYAGRLTRYQYRTAACRPVIMLKEGKLIDSGDPQTVILQRALRRYTAYAGELNVVLRKIDGDSGWCNRKIVGLTWLLSLR